MNERVLIQRQRAASDTVTQPILTRPGRGFGAQLVTTSARARSSSEQSPETDAHNIAPLGHDISQISFRPQTKLTVSQPGDPYEQEADRIADQVMRMVVPTSHQLTPDQEGEASVQTRQLVDSINPLIQRQGIHKIQTKPLRKAADDSDAAITGIESRLSSGKGGGRPLSDKVRSFMEPRFGVDFSQVRVHTDGEAVQMSRDLNAQAFTYGSDIYFGAGSYNPESSEGKHLLAHELTHVVQQESNTVQQRPQQKQLVENKAEDGQLQREEKEDRAFEQADIYYIVDEEQKVPIPNTKTYWGTVTNSLDDSYVESLISPYWLLPIMQNGVGKAGINVSLLDWRDTVYLNDQFIPELEAGVRWEQRQAHERLTVSPGFPNYKPDGGGGMQVTVHYSYGGYKEKDGRKIGYHNLLFNITYASQMSTTSGAELEIGPEYKGAGTKVTASSSVTVSAAAMSFVRELAFHSESF